MNEKNWTPAEIGKLSGQAWTALALQAAVKLDIFTAIDNSADKAVTIEGLAAKTGCDRRGLDMLTTALVALGFLARRGDKLALPDNSAKYLSANSDDYFGFAIKHMSNVLAGWTKLAAAVKTGASVCGRAADDTTVADREENFLMGMFNVARQQAQEVAEVLNLSGRQRLLDLGGGPGTYAIYFCRRNPGLKAVIFDQPGTKKFAEATVAKYGLADIISFTVGDFVTDELPGGFDAAWLSHVLHVEGPVNAAALVKKAAQSLKPGGLLAVQEFIINDDRCGPPHPALFSLNMLVHTKGGQAYTHGEICAMMAAAGLADIKRLETNFPSGSGIITGQKK